MKTLQLTLELLKRIRKDKDVTAADLQKQLKDTDDRFGRDLRTIQRLLESLSSPDNPSFAIERNDRDKPYGYRWKKDSVGLMLPSLSPPEALLLTLAKQQLANLLPAPADEVNGTVFSIRPAASSATLRTRPQPGPA